jgi:TPR repeat protein
MTIPEDQTYAVQLLDAGDYESAVPILQSMANQNSPYALLSLGWIYDSGKICNRDAELAALCYRRAAALGDSAGSFELGRLLYDEGKFVESREVFIEGGESGNIQCLAWYGYMMSKGEGGEKNIEESVAILRCAATKGQTFAKRVLYKIELDAANSLFSRVAIYGKILWLSVIAIKETLKDPYSDRGYR